MQKDNFIFPPDIEYQNTFQEKQAYEVSKIPNKKRKAPKDLNAPKRFKSPYIWFVTERMNSALKTLHSSVGAKSTDVMKILSTLWKSLTSMEKLIFEIKAEEDKLRYFDELAKFRGIENVHNKRQRKSADAPKRNMSAFLLYSKNIRPLICKKYPTLKNTEVSSILAEKWYKLSVVEKKPFIDQELFEREKYHKEMKEYKSNLKLKTIQDQLNQEYEETNILESFLQESIKELPVETNYDSPLLISDNLLDCSKSNFLLNSYNEEQNLIYEFNNSKNICNQYLPSFSECPADSPLFHIHKDKTNDLKHPFNQMINPFDQIQNFDAINLEYHIVAFSLLQAVDKANIYT